MLWDLGTPGGSARHSVRKRGHIALHVDDIDHARAELEAKGVEFLGEIFDTGVCKMAFFNDPDGLRPDAAQPIRAGRPEGGAAV
ncbi:MAG TPA: VOC family protein [Solirubrobacteraceae bacterium]|nr:VOC family protein [Solirubrobacteraceae bacterium]